MKILNAAGLVLAFAVSGCVVPTDPDTASLSDGADAAEEAASAIKKGKVGDFCGGKAGFDCKKGLYCNYEPEAVCGANDAGGTCAVKPSACTKEYKPVCGCDNQTYGNACMAASNGVSIASNGQCGCGEDSGGAAQGELCGGIAGIACADGLFCAYGPTCGAGDQSGVCAWRPGACIQIYNPVCGCDGKTYGSACNAASAGMSVASYGECEPTAPVVGEGESCGGFRAGPPPVCAEGLFCKYEIGDTCGWADAPGACASKPQMCTKEYAPVCSCNGNTYGNACEAAANGASVLHEGECN